MEIITLPSSKECERCGMELSYGQIKVVRMDGEVYLFCVESECFLDWFAALDEEFEPMFI